MRETLKLSTDNKAQYAAPEVKLIGSFEEVTQGTTGGAHYDVTLPAGTPVPFGLAHTS